ncbi:MAG TPA: class I SAM-dependent methyltransferase [Gemmatimonadaceae bacterium]|nr:class I SAM-dependent methyltransferase [Gemmatimonadaceae bacterium]
MNEVPAILDRYKAGDLSAPVTLMQLLIETEDVSATRAAVAGFDELDALLAANAAGCERIASMLRADVDSAKPAASVEEGIAFCERLFDWSVQQSEEASVALYSLGNPALLEQATAEIVAQLRSWDAVTGETVMLDIGCGIGRLLAALAPEIRTAVGIDVSAEMVKAAGRRCEPYTNVTVIKGDGRGLDGLDDAMFDIAVAVDSVPYLRQSGYELVENFFAEAARVLKPRGQFVILNYSYSEDDEADVREVRALAAHRFELLVAGERPFKLWDGLAFLMKKSA